jgi:diketogulonate reductase-like aldo/keto reductase
MDFDWFSLNFTEFGRFFQKPAGSEGADFLVSAGFLNSGLSNVRTVMEECHRLGLARMIGVSNFTKRSCRSCFPLQRSPSSKSGMR